MALLLAIDHGRGEQAAGAQLVEERTIAQQGDVVGLIGHDRLGDLK